MAAVAHGLARDFPATNKGRGVMVLLFGAGLLLRTLLVVDSVERGYPADNVLR